jgi:CHAT domain-containing protein
VTADKLGACLSLLADAARGGDQQAARQMFELAELAQGGTTSQQIALVSARLAENARDPKVAALIRDRDDANADLARLYAAREDSQAGSAAAADLTKHIAEMEKKRDGLDEALQSASPNYSQLVQQAVSADDILHALRPGEAFADIVLGSDNGWVFLLRDGQIGITQVKGGSHTVDPLVARIRRTLDEPAENGGLRPFDTDASATLYADLFGGVADRLNGATALAVAPSGTLLSLPFTLLLTAPTKPDQLADAPWLIRKVVVAHVPAPANFVQLRRLAGTSRAQKPWFGFGDFVPVTTAQAAASFPPATCHDSAVLFASLQRLAGAKAELSRAGTLLGASAQDELLGPDFTAAAVMHADLKNYRLLHFATHALLQTDLACQAEPALVTSDPAGAKDAQGALLTASQVAGLKLDADAVLLSACNTGGAGGSAPGESLSGLARSFFYAGARAMIVTHWDVNDKVAAAIIGATLDFTKADPSLGMAASLAKAQRLVLAKAPNLAHPFFWAPLALIGDGTSGLGEKVAEQ